MGIINPNIGFIVDPTIDIAVAISFIKVPKIKFKVTNIKVYQKF